MCTLMNNLSANPIISEWIKPFHDIGLKHVVLIPGGDIGSDHAQFLAVGLPVFPFLKDPVENDSRTWHTNMDTYLRPDCSRIPNAGCGRIGRHCIPGGNGLRDDATAAGRAVKRSLTLHKKKGIRFPAASPLLFIINAVLKAESRQVNCHTATSRLLGNNA